MTWLDQAWTAVLALLVVLFPGAVAALTVRLRGFAVMAAAAPLSLALLTAAALVNVVVPFHWSAGTWLASAALLIAAAFGVRVAVDRLSRRGRVRLPQRRSIGWLRESLPFAVVAGVAALSAPRLAAAFGVPSNISQTFDNIYHLNAVRQILDDGLIAPTRQLLPGFYPDLWHIVVSTVAELSGAGVAESVNVVSVVLGAVVWPISCIWLVRTIVGAHVGATVTAGALSVGMAAFPLLMLDFGVLYPNVLSISLLPSAIAAAVLVSGVGRGDRPDPVVRWLLLVALIPTLALAHPSTLMAFLLPGFLLAFTGIALWCRRERAARRPVERRRWAIIAIAGVFLVAVTVFVVARPNRTLAFWPPSATMQDALMQIVSGGLVWRPSEWVISAVAAAGVLTVILAKRWRRQWWLVASTAGMIAVYIVCIAFPMSGFRYGLTGTWYQDIYRIAALLPTFLVPLGALGVVGMVAVLARLLRAVQRPSVRWVPTAVGAVLGAAILVSTQTGPALAEETANTAVMYQQEAWSPLLTNDERALIDRLPETVPADDVIVGSPWTGTSLSFALANRRALVPHIFQELSPDMITITERLNRAAAEPEVCEALERTGTRWVLDFGAAEIHNGDHSYPGLEDLGSLVRLADSQGDARLYEIVACD
ncbi:hypothetical protein MRBLWO14_000548 [Microbacterium sp. LWO14-1.2]|uniref:DUF6541 family protein n=1 Tax=Microbacterium sp. LWO14-1.2 TaxID=3135263 RepID=UPI0031396FD0